MSIVRVPIDKVQPGMYLVGIDISWAASSFFMHKFLIKGDKDIAKLKGDGVSFIDVDTTKSTVSVPAQAANDPTPATPPAPKEPEPDAPPKMQARVELFDTPAPTPAASPRKELPPTSYKEEINTAKNLRTESVKTLKKIFKSSLKGEQLSQEMLGNIVSDSHDSILRNTHALLSLFHSERQQTDLENHSFNVMTLAVMLGERMKLSEDDNIILGSAALLMDIGWTKLPPAMFKYGYNYSDEEYDLVKSHVDISVSILEEVEVDPRVVSLVAKHHERVDGKGYFEYSGEHDVPLPCRILSMADHYNSRIRGYYDSPAMLPASVLKEIYKNAHSGSHDIKLAELLVQLVGIYPVSSVVQLNTGEKGMVTKVNWRDSLKPTVTIFYHKDGSALLTPKPVDLYKQDPSAPVVRSIQTLLNRRDAKVDPLNLMKFDV